MHKSILITLLLSQTIQSIPLHIRNAAWFAPPARSSHEQERETIAELRPGVPIERELKGGSLHLYEIKLEKDQKLSLEVDQRGIDVEVMLYGPDGTKLETVDSPNGTNGPEPLAYVSDRTGSFRLEIRSLEKNASPGKYEVRIVEIRKANEWDRDEIRAEKFTAQADELRSLGRRNLSVRLWTSTARL